MRSLNLDQLRALVEVVDLGSFSAAARRLNLTQPAVSLQIRELENRMAARLVDRLGKRAYATPATAPTLPRPNRGLFVRDRVYVVLGSLSALVSILVIHRRGAGR